MSDKQTIMFTLTMVEARSMLLVVLIVLSRVDSVADVCDVMHFVLLRVSLTSFNIFPFKPNWCFFGCNCDVWQKALL